MSYHRYWKIERDQAPWNPIPDTQKAIAEAITKGAMFVTCLALDGDPDGDPPPNRRGDFCLDLDAENPGEAFAEARRIIAHLEEAYGVTPYQIRIYLSGKKGVHLDIPCEILGILPGPYLHLEYRRLAAKLKSDLGLETLDMSLYAGGRGKMFRLPNVRRDNGRYKVPAMPSELRGLNDEELVRLTENPRHLDPDEEPEEPQLCEMLHELFLNIREAVAEQEEARKHEPIESTALSKLERELPQCIQAILKLRSKPANANFNKLILNLAAYFSAAGYGFTEADVIVAEFIRDYHSTSYTTPAARYKHWEHLYHYIKDNVDYSFSCGFVKALGIPREAFDCNDCPVNGSGVEDDYALQTKPNNVDFTFEQIINAAHDGQKGCAFIFQKLFMGIFCFDHAARIWYQFDEHYWRTEDLCTPIKAVTYVQDVFSKTLAELRARSRELADQCRSTHDATSRAKLDNKLGLIEKHLKALGSIVKSLNALQYRKQVVEFSAQGEGSLGIAGTEWDQHPWKLACPNGVVDLKTGQISPGRPKDYIKSFSPTPYDPEAECPQFRLFLREILSEDGELVLFVIRMLGAGLIGESTHKQYLVVFYGKRGRNGKDTLEGVTCHVLGNNLSGSIQSELLLDGGKFKRRSSQGPSPDIMRLRGLRLAWAKETSDGRRFDSGMAKMLSGGGKISARPLYGREVEFEQSHLIILQSNYLPSASTDDHAFWPRLKTIPLHLRFVDDPQKPYERKKDGGLAEKLKLEAPGILKLLVDGCLDYQKNGLPDPEAVKRANLAYAKEVDLVGRFIEEHCAEDPSFSVHLSKLYSEYKSWATMNSLEVLSNIGFGRKMPERFRRDKDGHGLTVYHGLELKRGIHS
jgi:putative DNA primase/helicase